MSKAAILRVMRASRYAVISSVSESGAPQAAVVGVAVTDALEIVFDTLKSTRKYANVTREPRVAFTFWDGDETVQWEGVIDELRGEELARVRPAYYAVFPDGPTREGWNGITWLRARPRWARFTDFAANPVTLVEVTDFPRA